MKSAMIARAIIALASALAMALVALLGDGGLPHFKVERALAHGRTHLAQTGPIPGYGPLPLFGSYTGPLDVLSGAVTCITTRACGRATAGSNWAQVRCVTAATTVTIKTLATGYVDEATLKAACPSDTYFVSTFYDNGSCAGNFTQATSANQPQLLLDDVAPGIPSLSFNGSSMSMTATGCAARSQPYTIMSVWLCTSSASEKPVFKDGAAFDGIQCHSSPNNYEVYAGTSFNEAETAGTRHTFGALLNGSSSKNVVDTTSNTGSAGTNSFGTSLQLGANNSSQFFNGKFNELLFYAGDQSASFTAMHNNQCAFFGTTC